MNNSSYFNFFFKDFLYEQYLRNFYIDSFIKNFRIRFFLKMHSFFFFYIFFLIETLLDSFLELRDFLSWKIPFLFYVETAAIYVYYMLFVFLVSFNGGYTENFFDIFLFSYTIYILLKALYLLTLSNQNQATSMLELIDEIIIMLCSLMIILLIYIYLAGSFDFINLFIAASSNNVNISTFFFSVWILFFSILCLILLRIYVQTTYNSFFELPLIFLFGVDMLIYINSFVDVFMIIILFEIISLIMIGLCAVSMNIKSSEALTTYFFQNMVVSSTALVGFSLIYFLFKTTNFIIILHSINFLMGMCVFTNYINIFYSVSLLLWLTTFFFKLGIFPANFYVPDFYEASTSFNILFMSAVIKPSIFFLLTKILDWFIKDTSFILLNILSMLGLISLIIGDIMALKTKNIKRFFGHTSISQYGFMLLGCVLSYNFDVLVFILLYIWVYNWVLFILLILITKLINLDSFQNVAYFNNIGILIKNNSNLKFLFILLVLIISGIPPFIIFFYKYMLFLNIYISGNYLYLIFILLLSLTTIVYYFQVLVDILVPDIKDLLTNNIYNNSKRLGNSFWIDFLLFCMLFIILIYGPMYLSAIYNVFLNVLLFL
jgi:NADH-quinone oxidoreductase subunit N